MKRFITVLLALTLCAGAFAQWEIDSRDYRISKSDLKRAQELLAKPAVNCSSGKAMPVLGAPCGTQTGPLPDAASLAGTAGFANIS